MRQKPILLRLLEFLVLVSSCANGATVAFKPAATYPVGTAPIAVASGDFNADGKTDLAIANFGDANSNDNGGVSVLLGNGGGTFQAAKTFAAGEMPESIAINDFNGDGILDIVAVSETANILNVLLGNGDGTFMAAITMQLDVDPYYVVAGDFNHDQKADVALFGLGRDLDGDGIRDSAGGIEVLLGNGNATFQEGTAFGTNGLNLVIADFNQDGSLDLARSDAFAGDVFIGRGDGSFKPALGVPTLTGYLRTDDLNGDGKPDIAAILPAHVCGYPPKICNGNINILLGNGDGTFSLAFNSSGLYQTLSVGDFDADGNPDLAVVAATNVVYRGDGQGNFNAAGTFSIGQPGDFLLSVDLNGDKLPDLVSTVRAANRIAVQLNATIPDPAFSISVSSLSPATVGRGQSSTANINLKSLNTFTNAVALTCSVQPAQSATTCSINPSSVTFDANGIATATLTINTGAAAASVLPASLGHDLVPLQLLWLPVAGFVMMGAGFTSRRSKGSKLTCCLFSGILFASLILQAACGGGNGEPVFTRYTITVTGTSGSTQHSTRLMLSVQ